MNILIVDGNEKEASLRYTDMGMDTQYEVYKKVLKSLSLENLNIEIIHPAISNNFLPEGISLDDFDGVAWTGSLLNIYDMTTPIINQIELAKELFTKKNKIFGSCWGLQVLVTAAGGSLTNDLVASNRVAHSDFSDTHLFDWRVCLFNLVHWRCAECARRTDHR